MTDAVNKPSVLFVCVKNAGKSQMAAGLMSKIAGDAVQVYSAGTKPGTAVNTLSAEVLSEVGVDITDQTPKPMDPRIVQDVDVVVTLGREAHIEPVPGTQFENWDTDEPSERGIDGIERMRLVRDDIVARVSDLRRRRDLARQRWPFGQHKMAVCLVAWTAVPESLRRFRWWSRPMISCRDEVSALTTTVAAQSVPRDANALWPGSDEDLRWRPGASLACHFARSITNKLSKVDPQVESRSSSG